MPELMYLPIVAWGHISACESCLPNECLLFLGNIMSRSVVLTYGDSRESSQEWFWVESFGGKPKRIVKKKPHKI
jgi:hypothetical protein